MMTFALYDKDSTTFLCSNQTRLEIQPGFQYSNDKIKYP